MYSDWSTSANQMRLEFTLSNLANESIEFRLKKKKNVLIDMPTTASRSLLGKDRQSRFSTETSPIV